MDTEQLMMKKSLYEGETWLGKPPEIEESRIEKTMEADVVVVGAGLAGVAAARAAAELGSTVLLLEKCEAPQARSGDFAVWTAVWRMFGVAATWIRSRSSTT